MNNVNMNITTKRELCVLASKVLSIDTELKKEKLLQGSSIKDVYMNIMGTIIFRTHLFPELETIYETYKSEFEKRNYEKLAQWTISNLSDLTNSDKIKYKLDNLIMDVQSLDIYSVIKNNSDWLKFKDDIQNRINHKFR